MSKKICNSNIKPQQKAYNLETENQLNAKLETLKDKINNCPKDFYAKIINVLTSQEREYLRELIDNKSCSNCSNQSCRIEQYEKIGLDEFGNPQGSNCLSWNNDELIVKQLILKQNKF